MNNEIKDNERKFSIRERMYFVILILVIILIATSVLLTIGAFIFNRTLPFDSISFSLVLSGLAIFVTGTIIIPKFLLEHEVKNAVEEYAEKSIQEKAKECVDSKVQEAKNDNLKTDAHLSRMIAFALTEKFPVWSIGWAFRSLKRYIKLDAKKVGFAEYRDFIEFIQAGIIEKSSKIFLDNFDTENEKDYTTLFKKISIEATNANEKNVFRPAIRAIKDISDFEYMVIKGKSKTLIDYRTVAESVCRSAGKFAKVLAATIMHEKSRQMQKSSESTQSVYEWLSNEIFEISDYGYKAKDIADSKDYKKALQEVLLSVSPEEPNSEKERGDFFFIRISENENSEK